MKQTKIIDTMETDQLSGARLILTNSSLSSLPMFIMGLFLLVVGVHAKLDTPRSKFYWEGAGSKHKYHMVKWAAVCHESGLWAELLKAKYYPNGSFSESLLGGLRSGMGSRRSNRRLPWGPM
jgi:hypothetical protein